MTGNSWTLEGVNTVSPMVFVDDAEAVRQFAMSVFGAEEVYEPLRYEDGRIWSLALKIGDGTFFVGTRDPGMQPVTAFLHIYVPDVDAAYEKAVAHGAKAMMPVGDQFYGERAGGVTDAHGNVWWVSTKTEVLSTDELVARARAVERDRKESA